MKHASSSSTKDEIIDWDNLIVSWKNDGSPNSLFAHNVWYVSDYAVSRTDPKVLNFERLIDGTSVHPKTLLECKQVFFKMWRTPDKYGDTPKIATAASYLIFINVLVGKACNSTTSLFDFLSSASMVREFAANIADAWTLKALYSVIRRIREVACDLPGLNTAFQVLPYLKRMKKDLPADSLQHPVIPTRILLRTIINYQDVIAEFISKKENIQEFVLRAANERHFARSEWSRARAQVESRLRLELITFEDAVEQYELEVIVKKYKLLNINHMTRYLTMVQYCCKMLIHIFSGMRSSEAYSINLGAYDSRHETYGKVCCLIGVTTKLFSGTASSTERWITSPEVEGAIEVAETIANIVYGFNECTDGEALFVSTAHLPFARNLYDWPAPQSSDRYSLSSLEPSRYEAQLPEILITEDDRRELQMTDFSRDWGAETKFDVGRRWPLTVHQIRRSLCVYAARSELVSLPSLKQLMKHITSQMTLYYMKGYAFSENLINPSSKHVIHDIAREAPYAESILYAKEILMSEEKLWGSGGKYLNNSDFISGVKVIESWDVTQKQFKSGQLSYRATMLGGCMSNVACKERGFVNPLGCVGCPEGVVMTWKVERAFNMQKKFVDALDPQSVEYRTQVEVKKAFEKLMKVTSK
jgi:hypothetical protein